MPVVEAGVPGTLPEGVFFHHELVDCRVETADGRDLGLVVRIAGGGGASLLVVNGAGREYLIPLAADICVEIDPAAKRIVVEPPQGLLDLRQDARRWLRAPGGLPRRRRYLMAPS